MNQRPTPHGTGIEYYHADRDLPHTVKSNLLVTTVRVVPTPGHDQVSIWNRGGMAGAITVNKGDGELIARKLLDGEWTVPVDCLVCEETHTVTVQPSEYARWQGGELIQNAMPSLSDEERELLISGTCGSCFDKMFPEEDT